MIFILFLTIFTTVCYYFLKTHYQYWERRGVPGPKPTFLIGNLGQVMFQRKSLGEAMIEIYNLEVLVHSKSRHIYFWDSAYPDTPIVGIFRATTPTLIIRDLDVVKQVLLKDFSHFHDNDFNFNAEIDPLFGRNPFIAKGEIWKMTRIQLSSAFTSGKMKMIYPLFEDNCERLVKFIETQSKAENGACFEAKELCEKFTMNNVASTGFGLDARCFEDPDSHFHKLGNRFLTPTGFNSFMLFMASMIPVLWNLIDLRFTPKDVQDELTKIVSDTIKYREENNIRRNDFLDLMNQQRLSSKNGEFEMLDIVVHAAGLIIDGYESSSIVMSFMLYELAANTEVQNKLREEVFERFAKNNGKLTYEDIQDMSYLDAVVNESLRLHPLLLTFGKICTKNYTLVPKPGDRLKNPVVIEKGTPVIIPVWAFHKDAKYFEEPHRFLPERFLHENKENITKFSFLPFGEGPKSCIGKRFGQLEIKMGLVYIIRNFKLKVNEKTIRPPKINPRYFLLSPIGGLWINFEKIE